MIISNWLDLAIIIFLLLIIVGSLKRGFLALALELFGFATALFVALNLYFLVSAVIIQYSSLSRAFAKPIGFFVVWLIVESIYFFLARQFLKLFPAEILNSKLNHFASPLPAFANGLAVLAFGLLLFVSFPTPAATKQFVFDSQIGNLIVKEAGQFQRPVEQIFGEAVQESLTFLTVRPQSREIVTLRFNQSETQVDQQSEIIMFDLVNQERAKRGLGVLQSDNRLQEIARAHSQDMLNQGYFSHYSPDGKDVGDRLSGDSIFYLLAGENLALAPNVSIAHRGLMESPGHKAIILTRQFGKIGVGVVDGGIYGKMFTQVFTN